MTVMGLQGCSGSPDQLSYLLMWVFIIELRQEFRIRGQVPRNNAISATSQISRAHEQRPLSQSDMTDQNAVSDAAALPTLPF